MPNMIDTIYESRDGNLICPYTAQGRTTEDDTDDQWRLSVIDPGGRPAIYRSGYRGYRGWTAYETTAEELAVNRVEIWFRGTLRSGLYATPSAYPANAKSNTAWDDIFEPSAKDAWQEMAEEVWVAEAGYELLVVTADKTIARLATPAFVMSNLEWTMIGYGEVLFRIRDIVNDAVPTLEENFTLHYGETIDCEHTRDFDLEDMDESGDVTLHGLVLLEDFVFSYVTVDGVFRSGMHLFTLPE